MMDEIQTEDMAVLVYESSTAQSRILQTALDGAGYTAHLVKTAEAALQAVQTGEYGIFISNIEHKDLSGLELFWRLKAEEDTRGIYCIAVTAGDEKRALVEALDSGADDFLSKPYDEMELRARLRAGSRTVILQRKLTRLALTDALTGIANRRAFVDRLESEVARIQRHGGQNSDGSDDISGLEVAKQLFEERGIRGFFDGLTPKMLRAAVNHSVTFYVYDIMLRALT